MSGPDPFDVGPLCRRCFCQLGTCQCPTGPWRKVAEYDVPDTKDNRALLNLAADADVATGGMIPCMEEQQPTESGYRVRVMFAGQRKEPPA